MNVVEKTKKVVDSCVTIEQFNVAEKYLRRAQLHERHRSDKAIADFNFSSADSLTTLIRDSNNLRLALLDLHVSLKQRRSYLKLVDSGWGNVEDIT